MPESVSPQNVRGKVNGSMVLIFVKYDDNVVVFFHSYLMKAVKHVIVIFVRKRHRVSTTLTSCRLRLPL